MNFWTSAEDIPSLPGAYVLAVELFRPVAVALGNRPPLSLAAGCYLYCGSAKGPGGLRARIARHMRRGKAIHWHIDNLTEAGRVLGAWGFVGGNECELAATLACLPVPIEGFGSSDCRRCRSHLLQWQESRPRRTALAESMSALGRSGRASVEGNARF
jgi:Uri superfamily endonuclease